MQPALQPNSPATPWISHPSTLSERIRLVMKLRGCGITDTNVLSAIESTPREAFVPTMFHDQAYEDTALPIACSQTISQPSVVGWMTWALDIAPRSRVLEIGTGSGYQTAILARLSRHVYTIERHRELYVEAKEKFEAMKLSNVIARQGDGAKGWKEACPFDRIIVTAAAREVPAVLLSQLAPGGVMVIPVGQGLPNQILLRIRKDEQGNIQTQHLMNVRFVPLVEGQ